MSVTLGRPPWCLADLGAVADALTAAVIGNDHCSSKAEQLIRLAQALLQAGHPARATEAALQAGGLLEASADSTSSFERGRIVEMLARLGRIGDAELLLDIDGGSRLRASLIGSVGVGRAKAGDITGALRSADAIRLVRPCDEIPPSALDVSQAYALGAVGSALLDAGALEPALEVVGRMSDSGPKVSLLAAIASTLCTRDRSDGRGRALARDACDVARIISINDPTLSHAAKVAVEIAAVALARCEGVEAAISFVSESATAGRIDPLLERVADRLTHHGEMGLARAIAPPPDAQDADRLLAAADRLRRQGCPDQAAAIARQVVERVTKTSHGLQQTAPDRWRQDQWLGAASTLLAEQGAYRDALDAIGPAETASRAQSCRDLVRRAAHDGNVAALEFLIPEAIQVLTAVHPGDNRASDLLSSMLDALDTVEDREAAARLTALLNDVLIRHPTYRRTEIDRASACARMGDLTGALEAADRSGPLVIQADKTMPFILTLGMALFDAPGRRSLTEIMKAPFHVWKALRAFPDRTPGPKAHALVGIVAALAAAGWIEEAVQAEAELEVEPRAVLQPVRDQALIALSDAQRRRGHPQAAFSTVLRIEEAAARWKPLLELAAIPASDRTSDVTAR